MLSFILLLLACICFNFLPRINSVNAIDDNKISWAEFNNEFQQLIKEDDYSTTFIENEVSNEQLISILSEESNKSDYEVSELVSTYSTKTPTRANKSSNIDNMIKICNDLDVTVNINDGGYTVYSKYQFKRIIVVGKVTNSYGASKVLTYEDYNILAYSTEEETKFAYEQLSNDKSLLVSLVSMVSANDYSYISYGRKWGAKAIDLGYYNEYLIDNNCNQEVVVAVFDTGINTNHDMLKDRILKDEHGELVGYASITSTYSGYAFEDDGWTDKDKDGLVEEEDYPTGHGSNVSGIIVGLTPSNVKILPVKVLGHNGKGSTDGILTAAMALYNDEVLNKYNIVCANFSLGATHPTESSANNANNIYKYYFDIMIANKILPVVSSGNDSADAKFNSPAGCNSAITVGAVYGPENFSEMINYSGEYYFDTDYSNFGDDVDIVAPGTYILSASIGDATNAKNDATIYMTGTSQAAPHVSAAVALLCADTRYYKEDEITFTASGIRNRLLNNCTTQNYNTNDVSLNNCFGMLNMKYFNGNINCEALDTVVPYNGEHQIIEVNVTGVDDYTITYGFNADECNIVDITTNDIFKYCIENLKVYVKITAAGCKDTIKYAYLTITKANVCISSVQTFTYGEPIRLEDTNFNIESGEIYGEDNLNISFSTTATQGFDVGSYELEMTYSNEYYNLELDPSSACVVEERELSVVGVLGDIYGRTPNLKLEECLITNYYSEDSIEDLNLSLTSLVTKFSSVGRYDVEVVCGNSNYFVNSDVCYVVSKRDLTISIDKQEFTYGNNFTLDNTKYKVSYGDIVNDDVINVTLSTTAIFGCDAGDYDITGNASNDNYNITIENGILTIKQRTLNITGTLRSEYMDEIVLDLSACTITNNVDDISDLDLSATTSATSESDVGVYDVVVSCGNANYKISQYVVYRITQKHITITANTQEFEYGSNVELEQDKFTVVGEFNPYEISITLSLDSSVVGNFVGTFPNAIKVEYTTSDNYSIGTYNGAVKIIPCYIEAEILNFASDVQYGNEIDSSSFEYTITSGSIKDGDELNIVLHTTATQNSNVGTYEITGSSSNSNYNVNFTSNGLINIVKRPLTLSIQASSMYGDVINFKNIHYTIISGEVVNKDNLNLNLTTTANQTSRVGVYSLSIISCNNNYDIILTNTSRYIIEQRQVTVTSIQYSEYGNNHTINKNDYYVSYGSVLPDDNLNINLSLIIANTANVGEYQIDLSWDNENYNVNANTKLVIKPRALKIKINDCQVEYGKSITLNNSSYTIIDGNIINNDKLNVTLFTKAHSKSNIGNYEITGKYGNKNYSVEFENGNLTIQKRKITIKLLNQTLKHGESIKLDQTAFSIVKGEVLNTDNLNLQIYTDATTYSKVGEYSIAATSNNENYEIVYDCATLTINPSILDYCVIVGGLSLGLTIVTNLTLIIVRNIKNKKLYKDILSRLK